MLNSSGDSVQPWKTPIAKWKGFDWNSPGTSTMAKAARSSRKPTSENEVADHSVEGQTEKELLQVNVLSPSMPLYGTLSFGENQFSRVLCFSMHASRWLWRQHLQALWTPVCNIAKTFKWKFDFSTWILLLLVLKTSQKFLSLRLTNATKRKDEKVIFVRTFKKFTPKKEKCFVFSFVKADVKIWTNWNWKGIVGKVR